MNSELEAYLTAPPGAALTPKQFKAREAEKRKFVSHFLKAAEAVLKPVMDSAAETLLKHGYGATVQLVREQRGSDPNTFPYIILHFSPKPCPPDDLGYIYTVAGASVSFISRRDDLCVEMVVCYPASHSVEHRVNFSYLPLAELTSDRVFQVITEAVKQIIRR